MDRSLRRKSRILDHGVSTWRLKEFLAQQFGAQASFLTLCAWYIYYHSSIRQAETSLCHTVFSNRSPYILISAQISAACSLKTSCRLPFAVCRRFRIPPRHEDQSLSHIIIGLWVFPKITQCHTRGESNVPKIPLKA